MRKFLLGFLIVSLSFISSKIVGTKIVAAASDNKSIALNANVEEEPVNPEKPVNVQVDIEEEVEKPANIQADIEEVEKVRKLIQEFLDEEPIVEMEDFNPQDIVNFELEAWGTEVQNPNSVVLPRNNRKIRVKGSIFCFK